METQHNLSSGELLERFLRYVRIHTTSDMHVDVTPSTACQWDLLNLLVREIRDLGIEDVELNEHGYLIARIPSNISGDSQPPTVGFMAHVDTSPDVSGKDVQPRVIENYDGGVVELKEGFRLDPREFPELNRYKGQTIITTDGTTLLGADDKAGVAEILTVAAWLQAHPEVPHGELELIFTPDEETGKGMDRFPREKLQSVYCYTLDGGEEGEVETECFNAFKADVRFTGRVIHLGKARGKLVNPVTMAGTFISLLPGNESPESTDDRYGYYCPLEVSGGMEEAHLLVFLRDFELSGIERRIEVLKKTAAAVEALFDGGKVEVIPSKQYLNMREHMARRPEGLEFLHRAIRMAGTEPVVRIIRGGTDGARLAEMGIPTPNVFTGGHNYHSRLEWAGLSTMVKAADTVLYLVGLWSEIRD